MWCSASNNDLTKAGRISRMLSRIKSVLLGQRMDTGMHFRWPIETRKKSTGLKPRMDVTTPLIRRTIISLRGWYLWVHELVFWRENTCTIPTTYMWPSYISITRNINPQRECGVTNTSLFLSIAFIRSLFLFPGGGHLIDSCGLMEGFPKNASLREFLWPQYWVRYISYDTV